MFDSEFLRPEIRNEVSFDKATNKEHPFAWVYDGLLILMLYSFY